MELLLDYDEFLLEEEMFSLLEGVDLSKFKPVWNKIKADLGNTFKFIGSYGAAMGIFFPVVNRLVATSEFKVDLTPTNIALATLATVSIMLDYNKSKLSEIWELLSDGKWKDVVDKLVKCFSNIYWVAKEAAQQVGYALKTFMDMLGFVATSVPTLQIILDLATKNQFTLSGAQGTSLAIGSMLIAGKTLVDTVVDKLKENPKLAKNIKE